METSLAGSDAFGGRLLRSLDGLLRHVEFATAVVGGLVIFLVMLVGVAEISLRKIFNNPLYGQLDLIELSMCAYALLTMSYCWRAAGHIRVDLLIDQFQGRARWIFELITTLAALLLVTALLPGVLHFFENALDIGDSTINTRWPTWPSKLVAVFAFALLWMRLMLEVWGYLRLIADPTASPIAIPQREPHDVGDDIDAGDVARH